MSPETQHKSPTQQVSWAPLEPHDVNTAQNLTALTQLRKTPGKKVQPGGSRNNSPTDAMMSPASKFVCKSKLRAGYQPHPGNDAAHEQRRRGRVFSGQQSRFGTSASGATSE
mmetsp:Transcript_5390/g.24015  ORF Transcript_5390/g.24015 Transcript_5390/m.24015 type:complete len:112 (+) Transcript_5390:209-544(+)